MSTTHEYLADASWFRDRLDLRSEGDRGADDFYADCPCCGGKLHVTQADSKVLTHCFKSGCDYAEIVAALDEEEPEAEAKVNYVARNGKAAKVADYANAKGLPVKGLHALGLNGEVRFEFRNGAEKYRTEDGEFRWIGKGGLLWPEPTEEMPDTIYVTAGETDALTLRTVLNLPAHAVTTGEKPNGSLSAAHYRDLATLGVERVVVCGDADEVGQTWLQRESESVLAAGLAVGRLDLTPFFNRWVKSIKDVNDLWLCCEGDAKEFRRLLDEQTLLQEARGPYAVEYAEAVAWGEEEVRWLIPELIERGNKVIIAAPQKSLKTYFVLALAGASITGQPFLGWPDWTPEKPLNVLVVEEEGSRHQFGRRLQRIINGLDAEVSGRLNIKFRHGFQLTQGGQVDDLIAYARREHIDLIVLDPLQRLIPGVDENSNSDMKQPWDELHRITLEYPDCAVVVLAHTRKGDSLSFDSIRGASRTGGEVDLGIFLQKQEDFRRGDDTYDGTLAVVLEGRELPDLGTRDGSLEVAYHFDYSEDAFTMTYSGGIKVRRVGRSLEGDANRERVYDAITDEWRSQVEVALEIGLSKERTRDHLKALDSEGRVEKQEQPGKPTLWRRLDGPTEKGAT